MFEIPIRREINEHTGKLLIGLIALLLANLTSFFSETPIQSISASYHEDGWARDVFVGFLFAIAAFLLSYNGRSKFQMVLSKIAAVAAMGIALFPCSCGGYQEMVPNVHGMSAVIMFVTLLIFCFLFYDRAKKKGHPQARMRAYVYAVCAVIMAGSILIMGIDRLAGGILSSKIDRLTFYGERSALMAFGIAWLTASRFMPIVTNSKERYSLLNYKTDKYELEQEKSNR